MPILSASKLSLSYGDSLIYSGISLDVAEKARIGMVGPNGAGKTTLIKTLVGITRPTSGAVRVLELDPLNDKWALRKQIGYMPQDATHYQRRELYRNFLIRVV